MDDLRNWKWFDEDDEEEEEEKRVGRDARVGFRVLKKKTLKERKKEEELWWSIEDFKIPDYSMIGF